MEFDFFLRDFKKQFALFSTYILVFAVVSWSLSLGSANDPASDIDSLVTQILGGVSISDVNVGVGGDLNIVVRDGKVQVKVGENFVDVDNITDKLGNQVDSDGNILVKVGDGINVKVPTKDLPKGVTEVRIDKEKGVAVYVFGDDTEVRVGDNKTVLQQDGDNIVFKGEGNFKGQVKVGKGVKVKFNGTKVSYTGKGVEVKVGEDVYVSNGEGAVNVMADGVVVNNSVVKAKGYEVNVGPKGLYVGTGTVPKGMEKRTLSVKDNKLTGDLSGLEKPVGESEVGEKIIYVNTATTNVSIDSKLAGLADNNINIPAGEQAEFFMSKDGKVNVKVGRRSQTNTQTNVENSGDTKKPNLPSVGDPDGKDQVINDSDKDKEKDKDDSDEKDDFDDTETDTSGGWLKWVLIIGGAALGLILLLMMLGKKDKSKDSSSQTHGGGDPYLGKDDVKDVHGNVTDGGKKVDTKYNPQEPQNKERFCECNESGCFNCPNGNCYACDPDYDEPVVLSPVKNGGELNGTV